MPNEEITNPLTSSNPFAKLLDNNSTSTNNNITNAGPPPIGASASSENLYDLKINSIIERIFLFTINKNSNGIKKGMQLIFMEELEPLSNNSLLSLELLEQALFERLMLPSPADFLIPNDKRNEETDVVCETKVVVYLFNAFKRCFEIDSSQDAITTTAFDRIKSLIIRNISTSIKQPEIYTGQSLSQQWLSILKDNQYDDNIRKVFLIETTKEIFDDDELTALGSLKGVFYPMLSDMLKSIRTANIIILEKWIIPLLQLFTSDKTVPQLGEILIDFTTPNSPDSDGRSYSASLIGQLLSLSILPKYQNGPYEFYDNPSDSLSSSLTDSLWNHLKIHLDNLHVIFKNLLLMGGKTKSKTLTWIGNCLNANKPRGQIWNSHNLSPFGDVTSASDGFMINLCAVLLRLCKPLVKPSYKIYLVDPTYCAAQDDRDDVHSKKFFEETCLIPIDNGEIRAVADNYNFITECFFMTHKAIDLSYRVCIEKFTRMLRDIHRLQQAYQDASAQNGQDVAQNMMQLITQQTQQFLCLKNTILEPKNDEMLLQFYEASAHWLAAITSCTEENYQRLEAEKCYAPKQKNTLALPFNNYVPPYIKSIPEHIIENIVGYLKFVRHFENQTIEMDQEAQSIFFKMILIFMGCPGRARNPHLRAHLSEGLESLLPKDTGTNYRSVFKTNLFDKHEDRLQIVPNILSVFVGIEQTGQSVDFDQKFNYRRPMYRIMEFLWDSDEQKECFKRLANEAVQNIEAVEPPIFLRFIHLLINDGIFLLDESLNNLQRIRESQAAQDNGDWSSLPQQERQQNIVSLQQLGMLTKLYNIVGRETINTLKFLTSEIKDIFCHDSLVDRMAGMLNYFLLHLVGPKMKNFKVKDKKEYEFDPAHTVLDICQIYINLKENESFCCAIYQDGRSYSSDLFTLAEQVLIRIGGGQLVGEIQEFSIKVKRLEVQYQEDQIALKDPPEEYLDPIMSTLMLDPVTLPSSHVTVDRTTIARHLLSDQSDPFNRSPLTMDQIKSNESLREEIYRWVELKRKEYNERKAAI